MTPTRQRETLEGPTLPSLRELLEMLETAVVWMEAHAREDDDVAQHMLQRFRRAIKRARHIEPQMPASRDRIIQGMVAWHGYSDDAAILVADAQAREVDNHTRWHTDLHLAVRAVLDCEGHKCGGGCRPPQLPPQDRSYSTNPRAYEARLKRWRSKDREGTKK